MISYVNIFRMRRSDQGTEGILLFEGKYWYSLELPWRENKPNISCIPTGLEYPVTIRKSPKFGNVYWIVEVKGRLYILFHSGNLAGDVSKGLLTNTNGCILTGKYRGLLNGQRAVLASKLALWEFMNELQGADFKLNIIESF